MELETLSKIGSFELKKKDDSEKESRSWTKIILNNVHEEFEKKYFLSDRERQ